MPRSSLSSLSPLAVPLDLNDKNDHVMVGWHIPPDIWRFHSLHTNASASLHTAHSLTSRPPASQAHTQRTRPSVLTWKEKISYAFLVCVFVLCTFLFNCLFCHYIVSRPLISSNLVLCTVLLFCPEMYSAFKVSIFWHLLFHYHHHIHHHHPHHNNYCISFPWGFCLHW